MSNITTVSDAPQNNNNVYAIIDLGSNSFHLLVTQLLTKNTFSNINKVKRKVRLAAGLDNENNLSEQAIKSGLDCLSLFAKYLINIPIENISIVATATLRIANNRDSFLIAANKILPKQINLLSGEEEAKTIFLGATYLNIEHSQQLVIDIGGASTELIVGENFKASKAVSLNLGCVSFKQKYFIDGEINHKNFTTAINAATAIIEPIVNEFKALSWQSVVGSSGTMQALAEILRHREQDLAITKPFLDEIKETLITFQHFDAVNFDGLRADRAPVLASGLAILIALFDTLNIDTLALSKGALREGLLFNLLNTK